MSSLSYFVGVDVGTGQARAALVSENGKVVKTAVENINIYKTWGIQQDFYEQSSENIWNACLSCIKKVIQDTNPEDIKGIGFDATCSLVAVDRSGQPLSLSTTGKNEQNVILWMDHRASKEAAKINELNHPVLKYVGGKISLEMETPKLLWIKKNLKSQWDKVGWFFDLPDFLTWKATGCDSRSLCSLVCKWTYEIKDTTTGTGSWNLKYFEQLGLEDLSKNNWEKIGSKVLPPGAPVGSGLAKNVAEILGLRPGTPVGASIIDAHAGGLGLVGCNVSTIDTEFSSRLSLICGTSTCHMAVSDSPSFVEGVWGPYFSAMIPGMWLNEGGQSASGKLLDHVIDSHPASKKIREKIGSNMHIQAYLSEVLKKLAQRESVPSEAYLTRDLHVYPDFHGNRSPMADPTMKGVIFGLTLSDDEDSLALQYLATVQALGYGTRHILETLTKSNYSVKSILICGGLSKNPLFVQTQSDIIDLPVVIPDEPESVLLGSAILGAQAAGHFKDMSTAIKSMGGNGQAVQPNRHVTEYHNKKYKVFLKMMQHQMEFREIMQV